MQELSKPVQENILTLLCFDDDASRLIASSIDTDLFESRIYRTIAKKAVSYFREYAKSPNDHLPDLLERELEGDDADLYVRTMKDLHSLSTGINRAYVLSQLEKFERQQTLRRGITEAAERMQAGDLDEAESLLHASLKQRKASFTPGLTLGSAIASESFYNDTDSRILTGITPLDMMHACPEPGALWLFVAPKGKGKSWCLMQLAKAAAMQRKKVLYLTLEMSEKKVARRFVQSFLSLTKRDVGKVAVPKIATDSKGAFSGVSFRHVKRKSLTSGRKKIESKIPKLRAQKNILIKQFPTSQLTVNALRAYLDNLEHYHNFLPDMVVIDYPDLMKMDNSQLRIETGSLYKEVRGIAVERNIAIAAASQSNRSAEDVRLITGKHLSEDYSKSMTADTLITYNQTPQEKKLGLARLYADKVRDDESDFTCLISQAYAIGQFFLDGCLMGSDYWAKLEGEDAE